MFLLNTILASYGMTYGDEQISVREHFRDTGAVVGQEGQLKCCGQWKLIKNKKIVTSYACFCLTTMLASKIIKENIENLFQFDLDIKRIYL